MVYNGDVQFGIGGWFLSAGKLIPISPDPTGTSDPYGTSDSYNLANECRFCRPAALAWYGGLEGGFILGPSVVFGSVVELERDALTWTVCAWYLALRFFSFSVFRSPWFVLVVKLSSVT